MLRFFVHYALAASFGVYALNFFEPAYAAGYAAESDTADDRAAPEYRRDSTGQAQASKRQATETAPVDTDAHAGVAGGSTPRYSNDNSLVDMVTQDKKTSAR